MSKAVTDCYCLDGYRPVNGGGNGTACELCNASTFCASGVPTPCPDYAFIAPGSMGIRLQVLALWAGYS